MKKIWHYLGNISGTIIAFGIYIEVLQRLYFYPNKINLGANRAWLTALITVIALVVIFWLYKQQLREQNDWGFNEKPHWDWRRLGVAAAGYVLIILVSVIMLNLIGGGTSANQQSLNKIQQNSGGLFKIMVAFIAPFCEEVIFRGMFFNIFFTKNTPRNKWLGIVASGFVFAYLHDPMLSKYILVYWVLGIILAWVYMTTKDLRYSMLVHMGYNLFGLI